MACSIDGHIMLAVYMGVWVPDSGLIHLMDVFGNFVDAVSNFVSFHNSAFELVVFLLSPILGFNFFPSKVFSIICRSVPL